MIESNAVCNLCSEVACPNLSVYADPPAVTFFCTKSPVPCAILIGDAGSGKSSLENLVCKTQRAAEASKSSLTRDLAEHLCSYGNGSFSLVDTPYTDPDQECFKHAHFLYAALTAKPYNSILVVVGYRPRYNAMLRSLKKHIHLVQEYSNMVTVVVTHWDNAKDSERDEVISTLKDGNPRRQIILLSKFSCPFRVSNALYSVLSRSKPAVALNIDRQHFYLKFDLVDAEFAEIEHRFTVHQEEIKGLKNHFLKLLAIGQDASRVPSEERDDYIHSLMVSFKYELQNLKERFEDRHGDGMTRLNFFLCHVELQKLILRETTNFCERACKLMAWNLMDYTDPRNQIKRCPHCYLVWVKVGGCDGATTCGNHSFGTVSERATRVFCKYKFVFNEALNSWDYAKNIVRPEFFAANKEESPTFLEKATRFYMACAISYMKLSAISERLARSPDCRDFDPRPKYVGCGKQIIWSELPKLADQEIMQLMNVTSIEEVKALLMNPESAVLQEHVSQLDQELHRMPYYPRVRE
mmetsp:Transcript_6939/g.12625  ORF Transcript_6939/g.12625 Transcript_6939/m.12625 type:complete len:524 (+) Transcript_6939:268-1839(+)|eukprot:CAMPEP_0204898192 /NCGR_PEP_ID=MMETSP1397-20131031/1138_1 /ASSEMBLY_ACC=CAM_ASM_000891 /TAXON_ID=49980 /ORGANISM="Climacostomum Climacostomum virens, Strain Stock W-24" /LENGTH=523 /DNA_ID=CAMNT_0052065997 /DNA_START=200 /DNA_END=1771 /DNA_ORIENTATION=+